MRLVSSGATTTPWPQDVCVVSRGATRDAHAAQSLSPEARALVRGETCIVRSRNRTAEVSRAAIAAMQ